MDLVELQRNWNQLGRVDPLWAILTVPEKINNGWDVQEFFSTGALEIEEILGHLCRFALPKEKKRALDFGCGVGRLTQALCHHFENCLGIDIAPSMIQRAREYNRHGARCDYVLNETDGLPMCETDKWDFIYSSIVLQHMKPEYSKKYIAEFLRILSPGGALVFQLPAETLARPATNGGSSLPSDAFRASMTARLTLLTAVTNSPVNLTVAIKNVSPVAWPPVDLSGVHPIRLGNHWLGETGEVLVRDDARAKLEHELRPQEGTELQLTVNTPANPGRYLLELDMVQEGISWFGDRGSEVIRIPAKITEPNPQSHRVQPPAAAELGVISLRTNGGTIEMYGVPKAEVLQAIVNAGGEILDVLPDSLAGPEWASYLYMVTKAESSR